MSFLRTIANEERKDIWRIAVALVAFVFAFVIGCSDRPSDGLTTTEQLIDVGVVREQVKAKVRFNLRAPSTITSIERSCGCTTIGLKEGQQIDPSQELVATIDLKSKPAGVGTQMARVAFNDGSQHLIRFRYDYRPLPYVKPEYALLKGIGESADLVFFFPAETDVRLDYSRLPSGLRITDAKHENSELAKGGVHVEIVVDAEPDENRGELTFRFSSTERESFTVPYLYLRNPAGQ